MITPTRNKAAKITMPFCEHHECQYGAVRRSDARFRGSAPGFRRHAVSRGRGKFRESFSASAFGQFTIRRDGLEA
jgi:hypothetical protein